jgi:hypothetical protein
MFGNILYCRIHICLFDQFESQMTKTVVTGRKNAKSTAKTTRKTSTQIERLKDELTETIPRNLPKLRSGRHMNKPVMKKMEKAKAKVPREK